jgi:hypothetical protein
MPELEQQLRALAAELEWPATPQLGPAVRGRLGRQARSRRPLVLALAAAILALAVALAVPPARSAILRFLHIEGVTVERVDRLPPAQPLGRLGTAMPLAQAERAVRFDVLLPGGRRPDGAYLDASVPGSAVVLRYGAARHPRLLVTEYRTRDFDVVKKYAGAGAHVRLVTVQGREGIWIPAPHVVQLGPTPPRLSGRSLIWAHAELTIRIEGRFALQQALALARSFR